MRMEAATRAAGSVSSRVISFRNMCDNSWEKRRGPSYWLALVLAAGLLAACGDGASVDRDEGEDAEDQTPAAAITATTVAPDTDGKMALWDWDTS